MNRQLDEGRPSARESVVTSVDDLALLADASAVAASTLDVDEALERVRRLLLGRGADACVVDVAQAGEATRGRSRLWADAAANDALGELVAAVVASGEPAAVAGEQAPPALRAALGARSLTVVPIAARGRTFGALTLVTHGTPIELAVLVEVGKRLGLAVHNGVAYRLALEAATRRDEVVASVAHDLRGSLSVVLLVLDEMLGVPRERDRRGAARTQLEIARRSAARMSDLLRDLLDLARCDAGGLALDVAAHDAASIAEETVAMLAPLARAKGLDLRAAKVGAPPRVRCDKSTILRVLFNLVGNAIKFTAPGGAITVQVERGDDGVLFRVVDDGVGIPRDQLGRIFDRFYTRARGGSGGEGTGLGLAIAKAFVQAHGGRIWAESEPSCGAALSFVLPADDARPSA